MHCIKCGVQLPIDSKEPLCTYCRTETAKEEILKDPTWAMRVTLEAFGMEINQIRKELKALKARSKQT
jgi:hypothetical protein